jgi:hypothetical protein
MAWMAVIAMSPSYGVEDSSAWLNNEFETLFKTSCSLSASDP